MKLRPSGLWFLLIALTSSCASKNILRLPSSIDPQSQKDLVQIQDNRLEIVRLRLAIEEQRRVVGPTGNPKSGIDLHAQRVSRRKLESMEKDLLALESESQRLSLNLAGHSSLTASDASSVPFVAHNSHQKIESLVIDDPRLLLKQQSSKSSFIFENQGQKHYALELSSALFKPKAPRNNVRGLPTAHERTEHIDAELNCDGEVLLSKSPTKHQGDRSKNHRFVLFDQLRSSFRHYVIFSSETQSCQLSAYNKRNGSRHEISIKRDNATSFARLAASNEACILKKGDSHSKPNEALFYSSEFDNFSCPHTFEEFDLLPDPLEAFATKVEMLTGSRVSPHDLAKGDPFMSLDFSKAPALDSIYVTALVFRADFSGVLMSRMLEFHAKRGTEVKLFISLPIALPKDKDYLERFPKQYPNFKIQFFKYPGSWSRGLGDVVQGLHRVNHIKALVTLSKDYDDQNQVVIGGRNYHDGFIFKEAPNHSKYPFMVSYGKDESFVHWIDLEMRIRSRALAESVAKQILGVWNRDATTAAFHTPFVQIPVEASHYKVEDLPSLSPKIRSFFSGPYRDEQALESFFVKMIDSARKTLVTVSPYLRLTDKVMQAMERAIERGVRIQIITRIDLSGDTAAALMSDVNKSSINKLRERVEVYEWTEPGAILHTKIMLIDDDVSFLGGVNLNKRSFLHDWENGMLVWDLKFNRKMGEILQKYKDGSRPVTEKQKMLWWTGIIIHLLDDKL